MNGFFITLEGGEGSGKTEQMKKIIRFIEELGFEVVGTREPGGVALAEEIRHLLLNNQAKSMDPITEALLYASARREHLKHIVLPALKKGKVVVSDRYFDSSIVYQGMTKNIPWEYIYQLNLDITNHLIPDVTFYFNVDPEIGLARIHQNAQREINRYDLEALPFHEKVRDGYLKLCSMFPRFKEIDANLSIEEVFEDVSFILKEELKKWKR